jgi:hypothetical protein
MQDLNVHVIFSLLYRALPNGTQNNPALDVGGTEKNA